MANNNTTQNQKLVRYLKSGKQITVATARSRYGVKRLSARIFELRKVGFPIATEKKRMSGRTQPVTTYWLNVKKTPTKLFENFGAN